jgi:hypothetical protein
MTRQALRRHRWSLVGPASTQALAAAVITMMVMTAMSLAPPRPTPTEATPRRRAGEVGLE